MKREEVKKNATSFISWQLLFMLVVLFGGCNKENPLITSETRAVEFTGINVDETQVRVIGNSWEDGDKVGLFAIQADHDLTTENIVDGNDNMPYETSGDGRFFPKGKSMYYPKDDSSMDIIGYYPYSQLTNNYIYPIDIKDQHDVLYSNNLKSINKINNGNINVLHFKRVLAKLIINVSAKKEGESIEGIKAKAVGVNNKSSLLLATGKLEVNNSKSDIDLPIAGTETQKQVYALLLPTTNDNRVTIKFLSPNGKTFSWEVPHTLESGKVYTYNIKLDDIGIESVSKGYMEIPQYSLAKEAPNSIKAMHMVEKVSWLNPSFTYSDDLIRNYTVLYDTENRVPYWIAFPMHPMYMASGNRTDEWGFDPFIPEKDQPSLFSSWSTKDLDRGHLLASADRNATIEINKTTFYFTNMAPQNNKMNGGNWATLEGKVRNWSTQADYDTLYVVTGTILPKVPSQFTYTTDDNGKQSVVPTHLYKALLRKKKDTGEYTSIAFKMANDDSGTPYSQSIISVEELEEETGFTFFNLLPQSSASEIKKNKNISPHWN